REDIFVWSRSDGSESPIDGGSGYLPLSLKDPARPLLHAHVSFAWASRRSAGRPRFLGNEECPRCAPRARRAPDLEVARGERTLGNTPPRGGSGDRGALCAGEGRGVGDGAHLAE